MNAYYNDSDPFCAQWLKNLIAAGAIPAGYVDERSIADVEPGDLRGFAHVHFFAGIGGWAYALELAGWPADRPVWTGSCPCQPFSSAGRQGGALDERHLWPRWLRLIRECRPDAVFGEQVEGAVGFGWVDRVFADLEAEGYACGAAVLGAHSVGAPHIRQRLFWVADAADARCDDARQHDGGSPSLPARSLECGANGGTLADSSGQRRQQVGQGALGDEGADGRQPDGHHVAAGDGSNCWMADADAAGSDQQRRQGLSGNGDAPHGHDADRRGEAGWMGNARREMGRARQPWQDSVWLPCLDGKARRVEPAIQPLASGLSRCLEHMRAIEDEAFAEVIAYGAANQADANEILRMVRDTVRAQSCRQECSTRMCQQFHAQEVLLDLLLCKATACNGAADEGGIAKAREEAKQRVLRSVRIGGGNGCPSCGQQSDEQLARQPADALHLLPFVLARHAQAYWQSAIDAHVASNRVGLLRGSGNAITPQTAAVFITAVMECLQ